MEVGAGEASCGGGISRTLVVKALTGGTSLCVLISFNGAVGTSSEVPSCSHNSNKVGLAGGGGIQEVPVWASKATMSFSSSDVNGMKSAPPRNSGSPKDPSKIQHRKRRSEIKGCT